MNCKYILIRFRKMKIIISPKFMIYNNRTNNWKSK